MYMRSLIKPLRPWAWVVLLMVSACQTGGDTAPATEPPASTTIPFEQEGMLDFRRGDSVLVQIAIEIADTDSARARGLMQRTALPDRSGMLFLFNREESQSFWMANTQLSLDLMFLSADTSIVTIARYTRPLSPESISSTAPARFVIEVPAGFADTWGIVEGDRARWQRTP
jgi:hypothetical protein